METQALADLTARVRSGGVGAAASLTVEAGLARLVRALEHQMHDEREAQRAVAPVVLPAVRLVAAAGVLGTDPALSLLGPEDGQVWDVRRLTVDGLLASSGVQLNGQGQAAAPAGGAAIVTLTAASITPGYYNIIWSVGLSGTPSATDVDNFRLRQGTTALTVSANPGVNGQYPQATYGPIFLTGANSVNIVAISAATAGSVYDAEITLQPLASDQVTLYREISGAGGGNPENRLHTFTAPGTSPGPDWSPGGGLILRSPEGLLLAGSNLGAAAVTLSGEAIAIDARWLWKYLL